MALLQVEDSRVREPQPDPVRSFDCRVFRVGHVAFAEYVLRPCADDDARKLSCCQWKNGLQGRAW